ncbi:TOTE conflict system archaeo-eukaryotic primase domain-containing protein [Siminovitchia sp. 179-K 8D1 HS]|uniref:TOTE conflict system archaeo-eukaryotic primase domain-containing protein n=1 Tax=Siminovitchia sp. 179-K 8D1 HS TaxID=3142385 RepID=UPI00399F062F
MRDLLKEYNQLRRENQYLKQVLTKMMHIQGMVNTERIITNQSAEDEKIRLFKDLFKGRMDVYAIRWESADGRSGYTPACANEWQKPLCLKPQIRCSQCQNRRFLHLTEQDLYEHLSGKKTIGIYPLLPDETCWFLAIDFDKKQWKRDVIVFIETCKKFNVPSHIERSRSGNGGHVWIFFSSAIPSSIARNLGINLIKKTKSLYYEFGLESFDRMFPNQNHLRQGGIGNLIALPLQKKARQKGNSVFVNESFVPYPDQWMYLSSVHRLNKQEVLEVIQACSEEEAVISQGVPLPQKIVIHLKNGIHIKKASLSSSMLSELADIASFKNPEFYKAQAKRLSTHKIPRNIHCASENENQLILPRGCLEQLLDSLKERSIEVDVMDHTYEGEPIVAEFQGVLSSQQAEVVNVLLENNTGTLSATTGFGKTVVATALIAERKVNTLIIVHRTQLMKQWVEQIAAFLNIPPADIGQIGGGKNKITGKIDVATLQSINFGGELKSFITQYGQIIVDECHVISAFTFEKVLKQIRARYVVGLTATPIRKDGLHPIITMQCGPIRYTVDARTQSLVRPFIHRLVVRETDFQTEKTEFHEIYQELLKDEARNQNIFEDVLQSLEEGRSPLILTERLEHLRILEQKFRGFAKNIIVLSGNIKKKDLRKELQRLSEIPMDEERLLIATGKYIGEGFDDARLDTLFLTMPISWKGTLQQYVGRLHRNFDGKEEVRVYDYVDDQVPVLKSMAQKRLEGYKRMGYIAENGKQVNEQMRLF